MPSSQTDDLFGRNSNVFGLKLPPKRNVPETKIRFQHSFHFEILLPFLEIFLGIYSPLAVVTAEVWLLSQLVRLCGFQIPLDSW